MCHCDELFSLVVSFAPYGGKTEESSCSAINVANGNFTTSALDPCGIGTQSRKQGNQCDSRCPWDVATVSQLLASRVRVDERNTEAETGALLPQRMPHTGQQRVGCDVYKILDFIQHKFDKMVGSQCWFPKHLIAVRKRESFSQFAIRTRGWWFSTTWFSSPCV